MHAKHSEMTEKTNLSPSDILQRVIAQTLQTSVFFVTIGSLYFAFEEPDLRVPFFKSGLE